MPLFVAPGPHDNACSERGGEDPGRQVHQRPAAVKPPRSAPLGAVVVLLRAKPVHLGAGQNQFPKTALLERLADVLINIQVLLCRIRG